MKSSVKQLEETKYELTVSADTEAWKEAQEKAKKKAIGKVKVDGFRQGKVPPAIAEKHIDQGQVLNDAINSIIPTLFEKGCSENKLNPFNQPQVNVTDIGTDKLTCTFTFIVYPKVELGAYKGLKIEKKSTEVTDKEVEAAIKKRQEDNAELEVKEGAAVKGDTLVFDFEGFTDGKAFEGGKAENYELELGSNQFVPGFEDQLVGTKAGDEKDVVVTFPENYVENLAGKEATFKCKVHEVKSKKIPEVNDEFVAELKIDGVTTVDALRAHEKESIHLNKVRESENAYYDALIAKIAEGSKISVAKEIVDDEVKAMKEDLTKKVEQNGFTYEQYLKMTNQKEEDVKAQMEKDAIRNIRQMLVINEIGNTEKIKVEQKEVDDEIAKLSAQYNIPVDQVREIITKNSTSQFVAQIRNRKIHDFLVANN